MGLSSEKWAMTPWRVTKYKHQEWLVYMPPEPHKGQLNTDRYSSFISWIQLKITEHQSHVCVSEYPVNNITGSHIPIISRLFRTYQAQMNDHNVWWSSLVHSQVVWPGKPIRPCWVDPGSSRLFGVQTRSQICELHRAVCGWWTLLDTNRKWCGGRLSRLEFFKWSHTDQQSFQMVSSLIVQTRDLETVMRWLTVLVRPDNNSDHTVIDSFRCICPWLSGPKSWGWSLTNSPGHLVWDGRIVACQY